MRVATFNLRYDTPLDNAVGPWKDSKGGRSLEIVQAFERMGWPDIVGTQEALPHQLEDLMSLGLKEKAYAWSGKGRDGQGRGEYCGIFYRTDRFTLRESGTFWLSETPDVEASKSWNAACNRIASWVVLTLNSNEQCRVLFISTHLDHQSKEARVHGSRLIVERALSLGLWFACRVSIIVGDFNSSPPAEKEPYEVFRASSLRDAYLEAPIRGPAVATFHGWQDPRQSDERIDWIWIGGFCKCNAARIHTQKGMNYWPSDHFPMVCELTV